MELWGDVVSKQVSSSSIEYVEDIDHRFGVRSGVGEEVSVDDVVLLVTVALESVDDPDSPGVVLQAHNQLAKNMVHMRLHHRVAKLPEDFGLEQLAPRHAMQIKALAVDAIAVPKTYLPERTAG